MKKIAATLVLAGLAATAMAQPGNKTGIEIKVRKFGTNDAWSSSLTLQSANLVDPIDVEVAAFYYRNSGYGLATVVHSITGSPYSAASGDLATILDDNPSSTQHPDGRVGNFNFGGQLQAVYHTGTSGVDQNRFRIAANGNPSDNAAGGISIKQNTPVALGAAFNTADGVMGYHFKLSLACYNNGAARVVTIDAPKAKISTYRTYAASTSTTATDILASLGNTDGATLNVSWAPAPASLALLGLGGLVAGRRRR